MRFQKKATVLRSSTKSFGILSATKRLGGIPHPLSRCLCDLSLERRGVEGAATTRQVFAKPIALSKAARPSVKAVAFTKAA